MPTADEYAQQHLARYGFAPEANNPVYAGLLAQGGGGGSLRDGLAQALMAQQGGGGGGNDAAQAYYQQHVARYGFAPEVNNATYNALLQQGGGGIPAAPVATSGADAGNAAAQAYYQAHIARYGFAPEANNPVYAQLLAQGNGQTPTPPPPPAADSAVAPMDSFGRMPNPTVDVSDYGNPNPFGGSAVRSGTPDDGNPTVDVSDYGNPNPFGGSAVSVSDYGRLPFGGSGVR